MEQRAVTADQAGRRFGIAEKNRGEKLFTGLGLLSGRQSCQAARRLRPPHHSAPPRRLDPKVGVWERGRAALLAAFLKLDGTRWKHARIIIDRCFHFRALNSSPWWSTIRR